MAKQFTSRPLSGEITQAEAIEMVTAYGADKNKVTKAVWFGLEQMDKIVTLLKAEKLLGRGTDGVRLYFGKYTADTIGNQPADYIGRNTILYVSTYEAVDEQNEKYHQDYFDGLELPLHSKMAPENRGELCQPHCKGATM